MYLYYCGRELLGCGTSYEAVGSVFTVHMAANNLKVGDWIIVMISNSGPETAYRLEIDW
jgi:hypothetical protein